jgi:hypothetical protein
VESLPQVRLFSLREANALCPTLQSEFTRARELREELSAVQSQLATAGHPMQSPEVTPDPAAPPSVQRMQRGAKRILTDLRDIVRGVQELGVEVKAPDGLVDFRSRLHGRTVYLCWRYGEDQITHYHELDSGFAGRRALPSDGDFVGDPLH